MGRPQPLAPPPGVQPGIPFGPTTGLLVVFISSLVLFYMQQMTMRGSNAFTTSYRSTKHAANKGLSLSPEIAQLLEAEEKDSEPQATIVLTAIVTVKKKRISVDVVKASGLEQATYTFAPDDLVSDLVAKIRERWNDAVFENNDGKPLRKRIGKDALRLWKRVTIITKEPLLLSEGSSSVSSPDDRRRRTRLALAEVDRILASRQVSDILGSGPKRQQQTEFRRIVQLIHPDKGLVFTNDDRASLALRLTFAAHRRQCRS